MIWTGTLSCLNTLMEDKRLVRGTVGDRTGQKTQTLIFTYGQFVNAKMGMCNILHQIAKDAVEDTHLRSHFNFVFVSPLTERQI